jgi:hypothetical protein
MSTVEEICEKAKTLPAPLQQEALDYVTFLAARNAAVRAETAEFTSELMSAFAEAKHEALRTGGYPPGCLSLNAPAASAISLSPT